MRIRPNKKREQLAVSIEQLTVSQEGILDVFSGIANTFKTWRDNMVKGRKRPKTKSVENAKSGTYLLIRSLRRTYLNKTWLSARTQNDSPFDISQDASAFFEGNKVPLTDPSMIVLSIKDMFFFIDNFVKSRDNYLSNFTNSILTPLAEGRYNGFFGLGALKVNELNRDIEYFFNGYGTPREYIQRLARKLPLDLPGCSTIGIDRNGLLNVQAVKVSKLPSTIDPIQLHQIPNYVQGMIDALEIIPANYILLEETPFDVFARFEIEYVENRETGNTEVHQPYFHNVDELRNALVKSRNRDVLELINPLFWVENFTLPVGDAADLQLRYLVAAFKHLNHSVSDQ